MRFLIIFTFLLILIIYIDSAPANTKTKQKNVKKEDNGKKNAVKKDAPKVDKSKGSDKGIQGEYYGGDMKGFVPPQKGQLRKASTNPLWADKTVPYKIEKSDFSEDDIWFINWAFEHYHNYTCIKFKERTKEKNYVRIFSGKGCYSYVGCIGGAQDLSLNKDGCVYKGTILHELMHALGFWHEHMRSDRDQYLKVMTENVAPANLHNFDKLNNRNGKNLGKFDADSVMLYGSLAFSKNGKETMIWKADDRNLQDAYNKYALSPADIEQIKLLYKC